MAVILFLLLFLVFVLVPEQVVEEVDLVLDTGVRARLLLVFVLVLDILVKVTRLDGRGEGQSVHHVAVKQRPLAAVVDVHVPGRDVLCEQLPVPRDAKCVARQIS